jgi:uncharacterized protein YdhG (YjbR/CyaY superfamily)
MQRLKAENVNEYIASFPKDVQKKLKEIRATIKKAAPKTEEKISYGIPAVSFEGKYVVYFAAFKSHVSVYPAPRGADEFKEILAKYEGGKGTVQFPLDEPLPLALITKIVKHRLRETIIKIKEKAAKTKG